MLERLTRNKVLQRHCLREIAKLTSKEVAKVVEWWDCSFAFPSEPNLQSTKEQSESTEETSGGSSDSTSKSCSSLSRNSSTESTEEKSSEGVPSESEVEHPCRFKTRQLACKLPCVETSTIVQNISNIAKMKRFLAIGHQNLYLKVQTFS